MADTNDLDELLAAFADGELDAARSREVEQMIAANPALRRSVEIHQEMSALLRAACAETFYAPGTGQLLNLWPRRRSRAPILWAVAASLALFVVGLGGGRLWSERLANPHESLVDAVAEYHAVYSRETTHLVEVPAQQAEHLKTWLGRRVDQKLEIPDLEAEGMHFAGGRLLVVDGKPVAELVYTRATGLPIALCISKMEQTREAGPTTPRLDQRGGLNLVSWQDGNHAYVVVGELGTDRLREIASRVMAGGSG